MIIPDAGKRNITHILLGASKTADGADISATQPSLKAARRREMLPPHLPVVDMQWVNNCITQKRLVLILFDNKKLKSQHKACIFAYFCNFCLFFWC